MSGGLRVEARDHVLYLTIDRPEVKNALDPPTLDALEAAWQRLDGDDDLWAALVTGTGETYPGCQQA